MTSTENSGLPAPNVSPVITGVLFRVKSTLGVLTSVMVTILGLLLVTFVIGRVVPIDPVLAVVGDQASQETYAAARAEMGLDKPLFVQIGRYFSQLGHGDLGISTLTGRPIVDDIVRYFPATLELASLAMLFGVLLGIPAGVISAARRGRLPDHIIRVFSLIGYSMPTFWLGMMAFWFYMQNLVGLQGPGGLTFFMTAWCQL